MKFIDLAKETATATGSNPLVLGGASTNYRVFAPVNGVGYSVGETVPYKAAQGALWEVGRGTKTANSIERTTVLASSNNDAPVNFAAGPIDVQCNVGASFLSSLHAPANIPFSANVPLTNKAGDTMAVHTVVGPLAFNPIAGAVASAFTIAELVHDGVSEITFPGFTELGSSSGVDKRNGIRHYIQFSQLGVTSCYSVVTAANAVPVDGTAPTIVSATVANATPSVLRLTMSEAIDSTYPAAAAAFAVGGHASAAGNVTVSGIYVDVPLATPFVYGEAARTVVYTPPGTNNLRDMAGNLLGTTGTPVPITNNLAAPATKPATMAKPTVSAGQLQASVAFVAPNNGGSAIISFEVTASTGQKATGTSSPISITMPAGAATFTVTATNGAGTSDPSPASDSVTISAAATAPAQMAKPTATATGATTANVALTAPNDGGSPITGYTVTSNPAGGVDSNAGTTALTHNMTGLTTGQAYTFTGTATNAIGTSPESPASDSVTPAASGAVEEDGRLTALDRVTEEGTAAPYAYYANAASAYGGSVTAGGLATKALQAGVDGYMQFTLGGSTTGMEPMLVLKATNTLGNLSTTTYGLFVKSGSGGYQPYTNGAAGTAASVNVRAIDDKVRLRRSGTTIVAEVQRAAGGAWITIYTWADVPTGILYYSVLMAGSANGTMRVAAIKYLGLA